LLYRLLFLIRSSLGCLELVSSNTFVAIFNHLLSFCSTSKNDRQDIDLYPEEITSLCFEVLKKFVSTRELGSKMKNNAYETLGCFEGIRYSSIPSYFDFIERLLRSPIGKEYIRYSGKILSIIVSRLEIEHKFCFDHHLKCTENAVRCIKLIGELIQIKGLLDEEYDAIEAELAKIILFVNDKTVDFKAEILNIGATVVKAAKSHLKIMDPIIESFYKVYRVNNNELTDLYEIFYAYIRLDNQFILHEGKSLGKTSLNLATGTPNQMTKPSMAEEGKLTPFKVINEILLSVLTHTCSDDSPPHMSTVLKSLLLIILELQIWNEAGLIPQFKSILEHLCLLLGKVESTFDNNRENTNDKVTILYIWLILSLLNAYHYYHEDIASEVHVRGFIHGFINKGADIVYSIYPGLPKFLQKVFQVGIIRVLSSGKELELDDENATFLITIISNILHMEISATTHEDDSILGSHLKLKNNKKLKKTYRRSKDSSTKPSNNSTADLVKEEGLISEISIVPEHESKDFYLTTVNMFTYLQRTFQDLKEANPSFVEALKLKLSNEDQLQLNEVLSVSVIQNTTSLVSIDPKTHLMKEKPNNGMGIRKIAKVARRDPKEFQ
jgi:hypothetical protein